MHIRQRGACAPKRHFHVRASAPLCGWLSYSCGTAAGAATPLRSFRPKKGATPPFGMPRSASGRAAHVHAHATLRRRVAPSHGSLREGCQSDAEAGDARPHGPRFGGRDRPRLLGAVSRQRRQPRAGLDRLPRSGLPHGDPRLVLRGARRRRAALRQPRPLGLESLAPATSGWRRPGQAACLARLARGRGALARGRRAAPPDRSARERAALLARRSRDGALHRYPDRRRRRLRQDLGLHVSVRPAAPLLAGRLARTTGQRLGARGQGRLLPRRAGDPRGGRAARTTTWRSGWTDPGSGTRSTIHCSTLTRSHTASPP